MSSGIWGTYEHTGGCLWYSCTATLYENVDRTTAKDRMRKVMPEPAYFVIARVFHFRVGLAGFPTPAIF